MPNPLFALLGAYALIAAQSDYRQVSTPQERTAPAARKGAQRPAMVLVPAVPGRGIRDVPNIAIQYYDVSGKNFAAIVKSIEKQRPRDPATRQVVAGGAESALGASMTRVIANGKCTITAVKADFAPTAQLPRLVNEQALAPDQLAQWRAYLSQIEAPAAAGLWYVHDRLPAFEKSLIGQECSRAPQLASAAIARLQTERAEFQRQYLAKYASPASAPVAKQ